jgi:SNF2 family DNA or RNA helicase
MSDIQITIKKKIKIPKPLSPDEVKQLLKQINALKIVENYISLISRDILFYIGEFLDYDNLLSLSITNKHINYNLNHESSRKLWNYVSYEYPNEFGVRLRRGWTLKPHQIAAVKWMIEREEEPIAGIYGGLNSSSVGTGKSLQAITLIMHDYASSIPPEYPNLIICPLSTIYTWKEQLDLFVGESCPYLVIRPDETDKNIIDNLTLEYMKKYKVIIINCERLRSIASKYELYDNLFEYDAFGRKIGINKCKPPSVKSMKDRGEIMIFNTPYHRIIFDESHHASNPKTLLFYSIMCLYSKRKWCMTGTPIRNFSSDLFSQFRFLGFDKIISPKQFKYNTYLNNKLNELILYMSKEDAGIKLPPKTEKVIALTLTGKEKEIYDYFIAGTREAYGGFLVGCVSFANVLTLFLRLRQCCVAANTVTKDQYKIVDDSSVENKLSGINTSVSFTFAQKFLDNMTSGLASWISDSLGTAGIKSAKIVECIKIIGQIPKQDKIIIFTSFKRLIDLIETAILKEYKGLKYERIDGDITGQARSNAINHFKYNPDTRVLIMSYKVGSDSLNLTEANHMIFMEPTWTPATKLQAIGRCHRMGQNKEVFIYDIIISDTIEQKVLNICKSKEDLFNQFIGNSKSIKEDGLSSDMISQLIK